MSRAVRRELFSTLETLEKANKILKTVLLNSKVEDAMSLLTDCQSCAIAIGNQIEVIYGNDLDVIHALENYCEGVYRVAENIGSSGEVEKYYSQVCGQLLTVREMMEKDIPDKTEVVFFPYKASMWDSLESVYLAAKEDENCDAYCVPIPYYDRNPDGSLGEIHYEGNEYPKNIEVIDYKTYNLEERHPDAIYIHNPYDEWNYVTCVPERYFAKNLRNYTDQLVYIPYFVLGEIESDNQREIDGIKHFCFLPGVIYAHKVIVQSENMRQIYINEYMKEAKENGLSGEHIDRKYLEKKILGLGSPKYDKVLNTKKEDLEIPEEWLKVIEKPDGSWKKIIFYNTSINALLHHNEKMLEKMKDVFRIFKENKDEVALLWRPHPLIKTTIEAMRPKLWEKYSSIVEQYRSEGWGIYDDSADMDRAVVLSDAYYGDPSSVVQVYQKTGKKVLLADMQIMESAEIKKNILNSTDAIIDKERIWILSDYVNVLFEIEKVTGNLCNMYSMPDTRSGMYASCSFVKVEQKLYFAPYNAREMWCFDVIERKFEKVDIGLTDNEKEIQRKFRIIISYENKLFLVGDKIEEFILIDLETEEVRRYSSFITKLQKRRVGDKKSYFKESYVLVKDIVYLPVLNSNTVISFNITRQMYEIYEIEDKDSVGYCDIDYKDGMFYLINWKDEQIIWHPMRGIIEMRKMNFLAFANRGYRKELHYQNKIILFAGFEKKIGIMDANLNIVNKVSFSYPETEIFKEGAAYMFQFIKQDNNTIFFQVRPKGRIFMIDLDADEAINEVTVNILPEVLDKLQKDYWNNEDKKILMENVMVCIDDFIQQIERTENYDGKECNNGIDIYSLVK